MADPFVGQLALFPYNFPPRNWAQCYGQLIPIQQNATLFALLGTRFGGNGVSNFGLPDLRGRVPLGFGDSLTGTGYDLGESGGAEIVKLDVNQVMGTHNHAIPASTQTATTHDPTNAVFAVGPNQGGGRGEELYPNYYAASSGTKIALPAAVCTPAGGGDGLPHNNLQPYLTLTWCISLMGTFPARP